MFPTRTINIFIYSKFNTSDGELFCKHLNKQTYRRDVHGWPQKANIPDNYSLLRFESINMLYKIQTNENGHFGWKIASDHHTELLNDNEQSLHSPLFQAGRRRASFKKWARTTWSMSFVLKKVQMKVLRRTQIVWTPAPTFSHQKR